MDKVIELGQSFLFKGLPNSELEKLAEIAQKQTFNAGDTLINQGEKSDTLMVIVMGSASANRHLDNGGEEEVAVLGSGSYLGESATISEEEARAITVKALEKTFVLSFNHDVLKQLCDDDPLLGYHVYRAIAKAMFKRISSIFNDVAYFKSLSLRSNKS